MTSTQITKSTTESTIGLTQIAGMKIKSQHSSKAIMTRDQLKPYVRLSKFPTKVSKIYLKEIFSFDLEKDNNLNLLHNFLCLTSNEHKEKSKRGLRALIEGEKIGQINEGRVTYELFNPIMQFVEKKEKELTNLNDFILTETIQNDLLSCLCVGKLHEVEHGPVLTVFQQALDKSFEILSNMIGMNNKSLEPTKTIYPKDQNQG